MTAQYSVRSTAACPFPSLTPILPEQLDCLRATAGAGPVLILTHDNPDPDSLASGKALATLLRDAWGISSRLVYCGLVARAENKAMLRLLTPEWEHVEALENLEQYSALTLVDTQPGAGNNSLPPQIIPNIVIDHHHPVRDGLEVVSYLDVQPVAGATVSLVYRYMEAASLVPDTVLATAIFYGIHADTRGLSRGDSPIDQIAYFKMLNLIDRALLIQVEQAGVPRQYFQAFSKGLQAACLFGRVVVAYLGELHRPDFVAEMADLLVRLEDVRAVLCMGYQGKTLHISLRTVRAEDDAGLLIQEMVTAPGKAGGHGFTAGGQFPLAGREAGATAAEIQRRFLAVMGERGEGEMLL